MGRRVIGCIAAIALAVIVGFLVRANQMSERAIGLISCSRAQDEADLATVADQCSSHATTTAALWGLVVGVAGIVIVLLATRSRPTT